jgi:hypothetical protein
VLTSRLPYALAETPFRFVALAALAGRTALGGQREVALATYLAARLADDVRPERALPKNLRLERAGHARNWLSTLSLPPSVRMPLLRVIEGSAGEPPALAAAVRGVIAVTAAFLDQAARLELDELATGLEAQALVK